MNPFVWLAKVIVRGARWSWGHPAEAMIFALTAVVVAHAAVIDPGLRRERDQARAATGRAIAERNAERTAHVMTKRTYRTAQMEAARKDQARLVRVAAQQEDISDEAVQTLARRHAAARAHAERLRQYASAGKPAACAGGTEQLPAVPAAAAGTDQAAGAKLPASPSDIAPSDIDWRLTAQEQAEQLDVLIDWIISQAGVPVNEPEARKP